MLLQSAKEDLGTAGHNYKFHLIQLLLAFCGLLGALVGGYSDNKRLELFTSISKFYMLVPFANRKKRISSPANGATFLSSVWRVTLDYKIKSASKIIGISGNT